MPASTLGGMRGVLCADSLLRSCTEICNYAQTASLRMLMFITTRRHPPTTVLCVVHDEAHRALPLVGRCLEAASRREIMSPLMLGGKESPPPLYPTPHLLHLYSFLHTIGPPPSWVVQVVPSKSTGLHADIGVNVKVAWAQFLRSPWVRAPARLLLVFRVIVDRGLSRRSLRSSCSELRKIGCTQVKPLKYRPWDTRRTTVLYVLNTL